MVGRNKYLSTAVAKEGLMHLCDALYQAGHHLIMKCIKSILSDKWLYMKVDKSFNKQKNK